MAQLLVIDDDPLVLRSISDVLTVSGYDVRSASNGQVGVQLARRHLPDLIICDVNMPGLDGYGVLDALQGHPATARIPFIFLTGLAAHEERRRGMDRGADDYLTKPYALPDLLKAVSSRLKRQEVIADQYEETLRLLRRNIIYALPHELRTPLTKIMGFANVLSENATAFSYDEIAGMGQIMERAGQRLFRLFENYLVYAQLELIASDAQQVAEMRNHIVGDAAGLIEKASRERAAAHEREADLQLDLVRLALAIAKENLSKIVEELVDNACKFSEPGQPVTVTMRREQGGFTLCVRDEGRGMTAEQVEQIGAYMQFERMFYEQQGVGLGLAIVRRLADLHGGSLRFKTAPDHGTTACVFLPM